MRRAIAYLLIAPLAALTITLVWHAYLTPPEPEPAPPPLSAEERATRLFAADFNMKVRPFVQTYCVECHAGAKPEAGLDLASFSNFDSVTKDPAHWSLVLERIRAGEMPPDDTKKKPAVAQRAPVVAWLEAMRQAEAKRRAGDPGLVLARRLSNAEYNYTIRDLTGVDLQPAKEFPVDPANEAGFDNSGESLDMTPSLVKKYLEAAQSVADHLVFKPDGLAFSPIAMVTDEDRDNYAVHRIVDFYKKQGLDVGTQEGNFMAQQPDYTAYFRALWLFGHRAALGRPDATLADFAKDANLNLKYLGKLQDFLALPGGEAGPVAAIQARWRALPAPVGGKEPPALATQLGFLRDFIAELRPYVTKTFTNLLPNERIIAGGSQTLVLWKDRQYADNRMTYPAGMALQVDMTYYTTSDPAMLIPSSEAGRAAYEESCKKFCAVFPDAFVVWERARMFETNANNIRGDLQGHRLLTAGFHSQMGYFRDDAPLCELMLDDAQRAQLDHLWEELNFIAQVPFRQFRQFVWFERGEPPSFMFTPEFNAFRSEDDDLLTEAKLNQLAEAYTAKAAKANVAGPALQAIKDYFPAINVSIRALEKTRAEAEPHQLDALLAFAGRAYRRPLTKAEQEDLLGFYHALRAQKLGHEDAIRDCVVSVLMSPNFGLRVALPAVVAQAAVAPAGPGRLASAGRPGPAVPVEALSDYELASRLSYFLWSTMPDEKLLAHAAAGDLHRPEVLAAEARRMMQDDRIRGLATEFGGNWLDIRRFEEHNAVDRARFPEFTNELREAMFEEPVRFFTDLVRRDGSVLDFIYGDYTFVNPVLAKHYGMPVPAAPAPDGWARVDEAGKYARGGLLPMAAFLTKNAPGLRTSPVKRGHWVVTKILGERIPAPPPNVPVLPADETKLGDLTLRQTLARHRADPTCASCHKKFDSFGLVFEGYGPVGEARANDLAGRPVQIDATFPDGSERSGLAGLKSFIQTRVQDEFIDNLARKLAAYALGRTLMLSDDLLIADMKAKLAANHDRFGTLVESLVTSPQFLNKRVPVAPTALATN
jgi:hypothetical protein